MLNDLEDFLYDKRDKETKKKIDIILREIIGHANHCISLSRDTTRSESDRRESCTIVLKNVQRVIGEREDMWGLSPWKKMTRNEKDRIKRKFQKVIKEASRTPGITEEVRKEVVKIMLYVDAASR